jgi:hypothetical protein
MMAVNSSWCPLMYHLILQIVCPGAGFESKLTSEIINSLTF